MMESVDQCVPMLLDLVQSRQFACLYGVGETREFMSTRWK